MTDDRSMDDLAKAHGKRIDGSPITDEKVESLADEAERGYDVAKIVRRRHPGRPTMGEAPAPVESVRLDPEFKRDLIIRAAEERISVSEVMRRSASSASRSSRTAGSLAGAGLDPPQDGSYSR